MKTRIKLGDILAVQCVNIITIACKVLKWIMAYFSTVFFLTTSMLIVGSDKNVEEMSIAMNMLIAAVITLCAVYLIGLLLFILIKYVVLTDDFELYMLGSLDKALTVFAIIIGEVTIHVPIDEHQVSNALHKLIVYVCLYLLLFVVKRIIIHFLPERLFVSEKHEYVSRHLKYSWITFNSDMGNAVQHSPNTLAKIMDKFEDVFDFSRDESENVESSNNHTKVDNIPTLHTAVRSPAYDEITRVIHESTSIIRDKMGPNTVPAIPFKMMVPVNNRKLPFKHPLRIIGTGYMPYALEPVLNISYNSDDDSDDDSEDDSEDDSDDDSDDDSEDDSEDDSDDRPYSPMGDIVI